MMEITGELAWAAGRVAEEASTLCTMEQMTTEATRNIHKQVLANQRRCVAAQLDRLKQAIAEYEELSDEETSHV